MIITYRSRLQLLNNWYFLPSSSSSSMKTLFSKIITNYYCIELVWIDAEFSLICNGRGRLFTRIATDTYRVTYWDWNFYVLFIKKMMRWPLSKFLLDFNKNKTYARFYKYLDTANDMNLLRCFNYSWNIFFIQT